MICEAIIGERQYSRNRLNTNSTDGMGKTE